MSKWYKFVHKKVMRRFEISDADWNKIKPMLPGKESDPGRSATDNRLFINAIMFVAHTGIAWRDLPERFGNWNSVYVRFRRWAKTEVWQKIFKKIRDTKFKTLLIDSTVVRVHKHGAGALKKKVGRQRRPLAEAGAD
jgi:transposase